jgi:putative SbcD/Mre11-related phosphoesterase
MDLKQIQPVTNEPVLFIKKEKILVVADLHIGIESELKNYGLTQMDHTEKMLNHFLQLCEKQKPKEIILLGDIKHNIPSTTYRERKDVKNFLEDIKNIASIHVIPGNHDGNINWLAPSEIKIQSSEGYILENIGFVHGHRWPSEDIMNSEQIIMAHTHPTYLFQDRLEHKTYEPCWVKTCFIEEKLKEKYPSSKNPFVLIIPAFNSLTGGTAVNRDNFIGPLGRIVEKENSEFFLLDGTSLGGI